MDWNQEYKDAGYLTYVEAYVASWIEILLGYNNISVYKVEAYVASWIEIWTYTTIFLKQMSRGLRSLVDWNTIPQGEVLKRNRRGLRSLVDWNPVSLSYNCTTTCRGLRSLVDWNLYNS